MIAVSSGRSFGDGGKFVVFREKGAGDRKPYMFSLGGGYLRGGDVVEYFVPGRGLKGEEEGEAYFRRGMCWADRQKGGGGKTLLRCCTYDLDGPQRKFGGVLHDMNGLPLLGVPGHD